MWLLHGFMFSSTPQQVSVLQLQSPSFEHELKQPYVGVNIEELYSSNSSFGKNSGWKVIHPIPSFWKNAFTWSHDLIYSPESLNRIWAEAGRENDVHSGFEITMKNHCGKDIFKHSIMAWSSNAQIYLRHSDFSSLFRTLSLLSKVWKTEK